MATGNKYQIASLSSTGVLFVLNSPVRSGSAACTTAGTAITFGTAFPVPVGSSYDVLAVGETADGRVIEISPTNISSKTRTGFTCTPWKDCTVSYIASVTA